MLDLDQRGLPGVMVATEAFREAAAAQVQQLGFEPAIIWIEHPVQNRTDDELRGVADRVFGDVCTALAAEHTA